MLHEIKVYKQDSGINIESDVLKKLTKEKFFASLQDHQIDLKYLAENHKDDPNYVGKFNLFLRTMKRSYHIMISESIVYLEDEGVKQKFLLSLLSQQNMFSLETELREKYKLAKANPNILDQYFE